MPQFAINIIEPCCLLLPDQWAAKRGQANFKTHLLPCVAMDD
jgi:hypothetical protein